jgi:hypothetical protein
VFVPRGHLLGVLVLDVLVGIDSALTTFKTARFALFAL